ncbi:ATP-dependent helicase [Blattabacterium cuenoti]|uniref:ATP-dependent helicase n=1 Tax=Blattabacterium cuenoti TaxID=1653831 RepID=UPI001EEAF4E8|nr:UvrD-helicase domain-containing protein [Blattabacterium cuenoti]
MEKNNKLMSVSFSLNKIQRKIIETIKGPILVVAGAGSGKTRVITYRIVHMIQNKGINPSNILALTFTKKAAKEMKNRVSNMIEKEDLDKMTIGTFHSIFSNILRKESHWVGYQPNYTIYDQKDSENVIKKILEDVSFNISLNIKEIRKKISEYKNSLCEIKNKLEYFDKIYKYYIERCFKANAMDFDDILLHTNYLFIRFPNILKKYQEKFKYILIDEYQDTNLSQKKILNNLALKHQNIFAVGDDAQSIYAFRGANISNILNFHIDYDTAKIFRLEQNYRSTNHIVEASNNIISFNKNQIFKKIWTNNEKGEKVKIYCAFSEKEEARYIANSILLIKKKEKFQYKDFAILYRINTQSHIIEYALKEKNIPYNIYGSISFEKRKEIRDLFAYFRIIHNPNDEESLLRILKKITNNKIVKSILNLSKIKNTTTYDIIKNIFFHKKLLNINIKTEDKIKKFFMKIENLRMKLDKENAYTIAKYTVNFLLKENEKNYSNEDFKYILNNILFYVKEQEKLKNNGDISLSGFLQYFYLEIENNNINNEEDKISLMTVHLSKGLEFSIVFIVGLEENLFPSKSSLENQFKIEEERRLFYVALTRAQKMAVLTYAKYRFLWGNRNKNNPSRFISELNKNSIDIENHNYMSLLSDVNRQKFLYKNEEKNSKIKKGIKVFHPNFGMGTILDLQDLNKIAIIKFKKLGKKKILLKLAKLTFFS